MISRSGWSPKHSGTPSVPGLSRAGVLTALGVDCLLAGGVSDLLLLAALLCAWAHCSVWRQDVTARTQHSMLVLRACAQVSPLLRVPEICGQYLRLRPSVMCSLQTVLCLLPFVWNPGARVLLR